MRRFGWVILGLAMVMWSPVSLWAQAGGIIEGVVRDVSGEALADVSVRIGRGHSALTDGSGRFRIRGVAAGEHRVTVTRIGYAPETVQITVGPGSRAEAAFVLQPSALALPGVQVTATPNPRAVSAVTRATTQLAAEALDREMASTVSGTLRNEPGLAVRSMGPAATAPIIRGLTGDRILVLEDGQRVGDLASSADDHGVTLNPLTASRIEVVRGPATLLYGNNALGGVVNVISRRPEAGIGSRLRAALQVESGQPGGSVTVEVVVPAAERWYLTGEVTGRRAGDARIPTHPELGRRLPNTDAESVRGSVGIRGSMADALVEASIQRYDFGYGIPTPPGGDPVRLEGGRTEARARVETPLPWRAVTSAQVDATVQRYGHDELDDGGVQQVFDLDTGTLDLRLRQAGVGAITEGAWGVSLLTRSYSASGVATLTPPADSRGAGVFGFQEIALPFAGASLQLGGRLDDYVIESHANEKFGAEIERSFRAWSGSGGVHLPLGDRASLALNVARSFRSPTVEELFSGAAHAGTGAVELGNPELEAEVGRSVEVMAQVGSARWSGQFAAYTNRIANYVHLVARGDTIIGGAELPVLAYAGTDATLSGAEARLEHAATQQLVIGFVGDLVRGRAATGEPLSFLPPARLAATARWQGSRFSIGGEVRHAFGQDRVGAADETPTEAHTVARAHLGARWSTRGAEQSVLVSVENLTDVLYRDATSRIKDFAPAGGRSIQILYRVAL